MKLYLNWIELVALLSLKCSYTESVYASMRSKISGRALLIFIFVSILVKAGLQKCPKV